MRPAPCSWLLLGLLVGSGLAGCFGGSPAAPLAGRVVDERGAPVGQVRVRATFTSAIPFTNPIPLGVAAAADTLEAVTGNDGRFAFSEPPAGEVNLEAIQRDDRKALKLGVTVKGGGRLDVGDLRLAPTGTLVGRVVTSGASGVSLLGTDVYTPGLAYAVKTDETGGFRLADLPAGRLRLVASHPALGQGELPEVVVRPGETLSLEGPAIALQPPTIQAIQPNSGAPGTAFTIQGTHFGRSTTGGHTVEVYLGGLRLDEVTVDSDLLIRARVPAGARSGRLVVKVGLISGASERDFQVLASLGLAPGGPILLPLGAGALFTAVAQDDRGQAVSGPAVQWSAGAGGVLALDTSVPGQFTGARVGTTQVQAQAGSLVAAATVLVAPLVGAPLTLAPAAGSASVAVGQGVALVALDAPGEAGAHRMVVQRLAGQPWGPSELSLAPPLPAPACPALAWDAVAQRFQLVYAEGAVGDRAVRWLSLDPAGQVVAGPMLLAAHRPDVLDLSLAARGSEVLAVWQEPGGGIWGAASGGAGPQNLVASQGSGPRAAWDGTQFWVGWQQAVGGDIQAMLRSITAGGTPGGAATQLGTGRAGLREFRLAGGPGHLLAVWTEDRAGSRELTAQRLAGGTAIGAPVPLGPVQPGHGRASLPVLSWDGTRYLLAWRDARPDAPGLYAQALDRDLAAPGSVFALVLGDQLEPLLAGAGADALALWRPGGAWASLSGQRLLP